MSKTKPATFAVAVTPSDTVAISFEGKSVVTRGLYVGVGGDVSVEMGGEDGNGKGMADPTVVFTGVATGTVLPIEVTRVNATGTTATNLTAIW